MTPRGGQHATAAAAALLAFAVPVALPAATPAAFAQVTGTIAVDLVESVGKDWFTDIGDREVVLRRVEGIDPTTAAGQSQLEQLDIPALVREGTQFPEVDRATTSGGKAEFTGVAEGVYLVETLDSPDTRDGRVSYSPAVVVVVSGSLSRSVAPKAQVLGAASTQNTACNSPSWLDAAAPNTYVEYSYVFNAPNPGTDGSIGTYEVFIEFSRGHTVQWESEPVQLRAAQASRAGVVHVEATAEHVTLAAPKPWWRVLIPERTQSSEAVKLSRPTLTLIGAGETTQLVEGTDYTVEVAADNRATFTLTEAARRELAAARQVDPNTRLELRVPAKANASGPWGSVSRGEVLGTLESTALLRADGMDALRTPVEVENTSHVNVVNRTACFLNDGDGGSSGGTGGDGSTDGTAGNGGTGVPGAGEGDTGSGAESGTGSGSGAGESGQVGGKKSGAEGQAGGQKSGSRTGLASTGASVLGITGIALLLILLGLAMRRRNREEETSAQ